MRTLNISKATQTQSGDDPKAASRQSSYDLQSQLRNQQEQRAIRGQRPLGQFFGDSTVRIGPNGTVAIAISDGKEGTREVFVPSNLLDNGAIADATGGATIDTEARAALNSLLATLREIGIITT